MPDDLIEAVAKAAAKMNAACRPRCGLWCVKGCKRAPQRLTINETSRRARQRSVSADRARSRGRGDDGATARRNTF